MVRSASSVVVRRPTTIRLFPTAAAARDSIEEAKKECIA